MPTSGNFWNLEEWVRRLGLAKTESPPLLAGVQPVVVLGDHSEVTSPLQAPTALIGGRVTGGVGTFGTLAWRCNSPGGCYVLNVSCRNDSGSGFHIISVAPGQAVLAAVITPTVVNMGPDPVEGFPRMGTLALNLGVLLPVIGSPSQFLNGASWFVPPGSELLISSFVSNLFSNFMLLIRDVPTEVPSPD